MPNNNPHKGETKRTIPKCLRCENKAFSVSVGFEKPVGYCKKCAEKILAGAMLMDLHNYKAKKKRIYTKKK